MDSYRTPMENFIELLDNSDRTDLRSNLLKKVKKLSNKDWNLYSLAVDKIARAHLSEAGVPLHPNGCFPHPHPNSKTIETFMLHGEVKEILKTKLEERKKVTVCSMKGAKFKKFRKNLKEFEKEGLDLFNKIYEARDEIRYGSNWPQAQSIQSYCKYLEQSRKVGEVLFLHDEIHHWSEEDLCRFLSLTKCETLVATAIYPIEILKGSALSLNPHLYEFKVDGNKLYFFPDGKSCGSYEQRRYWSLPSAKEVIADVPYSVDFTRTIGAHHCVVLQRNGRNVNTKRFFSDFKCFNPSIDKTLFIKPVKIRIRSYVLQKFILYMLSLKKPDVESAVAKLRQLSEAEIDPLELPFVLAASNVLMKKKSLDISENLFDFFYDFVDETCSGSKILRSFLPNRCKEHKFREIMLNSCRHFFEFRLGAVMDNDFNESSFDLPDEMDSMFMTGDTKEATSSRISMGEHTKSGLVNVYDSLDLGSDEDYKFRANRTVAHKYPNASGRAYVDLTDTQFKILGSLKPREFLLATTCFGYNVPRLSNLPWDEHLLVCEERRKLLSGKFPPRYKLPILGCLTTFGSKEFSHEIKESERIRHACRKIFGEDFLDSSHTVSLDRAEQIINSSKELLNGEGADLCLGMPDDPNVTYNPGDLYARKPSFNSSSESSVGSSFEREAKLLEDELDRDYLQSMEKDENVLITKQIHDAFWNGENQCLIHAVSRSRNMKVEDMMCLLLTKDFNYWGNWVLSDSGADPSTIQKICLDLNVQIEIIHENGSIQRYAEGTVGPLVILKCDSSSHLTFGDVNYVVDVQEDMVFHEFARNWFLKADNASIVSYGFDREDAVKLRDAFKRAEEGVFIASKGADALRDLNFSSGNMESELILMSGLPGSGKSKCVEDFVKKYGSKSEILVIVPRSELKKQWEEHVNKSKKVSVKTFETALVSGIGKNCLVVIDECFLFPNGYLDILHFKGVRGEQMILIGDPLQSSHHSSGSHEVQKMRNFFEKAKLVGNLNYLFYSYRLNSSYKNSFPFPCLNSIDQWKYHGKTFDGIESMLALTKDDMPEAILVSQFEDQLLFPKGFRIPVLTFGESQGMNFLKTCIIVTQKTFLTDNYRQLVGLTRAKTGFCLINSTGQKLNVVLEKNKGKLISKVLTSGVSEQFLMSMLELRNFDSSKINLISPEGNFGNTAEEKLAGDPWLKPYLFLGQIPDIQVCTFREPIPAEPESKTHLPICSENFDFAEVFECLRAKEFREKRVPFDMSSQFIDQQKFDGVKACQPMLFESIYPRHQASDNVTFWMAVKKRLKFSRPEQELEKYRSNFKFGQAIFEHFLKFVPLDQRFDRQMLEQSQMDFEFAKLKKDAATIANHAMRSSRDWDTENVFLFMKSQLCTKMSKRFVDAKAGQTLACFNHLVLAHFSKWCRYIDGKVQRALGSQKDFNFYIHTRKNFDQLNDWVKRQNFSGVCTESDYEAFDSSQDSIVLAFEVCLMRHLAVPEDIIKDYEHIKCHLRCKLGSFAIMRFTGEFCTFLFNTLSNMAFTFLRYDIPRGTSIAFAGDDMCASRDLNVTKVYEHLLERLSLTAKVDKVRNPTFCGWRMSRHGIVKDPKLIWERFRVAQERKTMRECLESYAIEACYAYDLGDRLYDILDETDLFYYQSINRLIVLNLEDISGKIKKHFSKALANLNGNNSCEQDHQGIQEFWESDGSDSEGLNLP